MEDYRTLFDLSGRTAVVVGAGSGIGRACAHGLAAAGARVICADLDAEAAAATATGIGAESLAIDITDAASVAAAAERIGAPDALVSTPSINVRRPLLEIDDAAFERVIEVNLKGTFRLLREFGRRMADRGRGSVVVFSSIRASVIEPGQGVYAATKAGTVMLVKTLASELGPRNVRVNAVAPGVVETPLTAPIKAKPEWYAAYAGKGALGRWAQPAEMVGPVVFLCSDASTYVTGTELVADGGWLAQDGRFTPPL